RSPLRSTLFPYTTLFRSLTLPGGREEIIRQIQLLGSMSKEEQRVLVVFVAVSLCWMSRTFLLNQFLPALDDTIIALTGALLLFLDRKSTRLNSSHVKISY